MVEWFSVFENFKDLAPEPSPSISRAPILNSKLSQTHDGYPTMVQLYKDPGPGVDKVVIAVNLPVS